MIYLAGIDCVTLKQIIKIKFSIVFSGISSIQFKKSQFFDDFYSEILCNFRKLNGISRPIILELKCDQILVSQVAKKIRPTISYHFEDLSVQYSQ